MIKINQKVMEGCPDKIKKMVCRLRNLKNLFTNASKNSADCLESKVWNHIFAAQINS
jgi:hypothetical protein